MANNDKFMIWFYEYLPILKYIKTGSFEPFYLILYFHFFLETFKLVKGFPSKIESKVS